MKDYHDINPLGEGSHHSVGIHFKGFTVCLDVQCSKEDADLVEQIRKYITSTLKKVGKKNV